MPTFECVDPPATQHTAGPYVVSRDGFGVFTIHGQMGSGIPVLIATCDTADGALTAIETEANARLFAAAPDLLAALADLVEAFVNPADDLPYEDGEVPAIDHARAVLTKARSGELATAPGLFP